MNDTYGPTSRTPFAFYDPDTQSLRTSQGTFDVDSTPSSPTLPASGSMSSGALFAHRRSALPTAASGSSSSPLLKTPTAQLAINGGSQHPDKRKAGGHGPTLADEVEHLLPTPTATPYGNNQSDSPGAAVRPSLNALAPLLLPTPAARDWRSGESNLIGTNARPLNEVVVNLLPTLRASDGTNGGPKGDLALPAVAYRLGVSSNPPSDGGSTPPDDLPPGQLTLEIG